MDYRVRLGGVLVEHAGGTTITTLPGGERVYAIAHDTAEYRATAHRLGYGGDVERMNRDHDLCHSLLARWLGLGSSPTLAGVAAGLPSSRSTDSEEDAVMAIQLLANRLGIDLASLTATEYPPRR